MKLLTFIIILAFHLPLMAQPNEEACAATLIRAEEIVAKHFQKPLKQLPIRLLSGGFSEAANFHIEAGDNQYVLRIYPKDQSLIEIQREFYASQVASRVGIAPCVRSIFLDDRAILMDYIPGNTLSIEHAKAPVNTGKIADGLRSAHRTPKNPYPSSGILPKMEDLYAQLYKELDYTSFITEAIELMRQSCEELSKLKGKKVNIHGDLNPRNIFITAHRVYFIDWQATQWEDPFYDLTNFSLLHGYSKEEEEFLLLSYLKRNPTRREQIRFLLTKKINLAIICLKCHQIMHNLLHQFPEQSIDPHAPLKEWSYYGKRFAENSSALSAQFFFEVAQWTLKFAHSL